MFKVAEMFAGIGGVTLGFTNAQGFEPVFLNDIDPIAKDIYLNNFPKHQDFYECGSIERVTPSLIEEYAGGQLDGLLGCPPCQGLSSVGTRDTEDVRNALILHMGRIAKALKPKFVVLENVPALLKSRFFHEFKQDLLSDYVFSEGVLNAAEYGVPQLRRRAIIIAFHKSLGVCPSLPASSHGGTHEVFDYSSGEYIKAGSPDGVRKLHLSKGAADAKKPFVTVRQALGDLPKSFNSDDLGETFRYASPAKGWFQKKMRTKGPGKVFNHQTWNHSSDMIARLEAVEPGFCPEDDGKTRNRRYFSQAYSRLHGDGVSRTITTNFHNPGSGRFTHYKYPRTITVREALRLQSFPDNFIIPPFARRTDGERVAGNAFPPILAEKIASHINQLIA